MKQRKKDKSGEKVTKLEVADVVSIYCNLASNDYQRELKDLDNYIFRGWSGGGAEQSTEVVGQVNYLIYIIGGGCFQVARFFYKQCQTEIGKKQANANQHPEAELLLFENYSYSSSTLSCKDNKIYSKK